MYLLWLMNELNGWLPQATVVAGILRGIIGNDWRLNMLKPLDLCFSTCVMMKSDNFWCWDRSFCISLNYYLLICWFSLDKLAQIRHLGFLWCLYQSRWMIPFSLLSRNSILLFQSIGVKFLHCNFLLLLSSFGMNLSRYGPCVLGWTLCILIVYHICVL